VITTQTSFLVAIPLIRVIEEQWMYWS
jgi:hypothetical protein